jgi:hypothetical protein
MVHKENNILRIRIDGYAPSCDIVFIQSYQSFIANIRKNYFRLEHTHSA